MRIEINTQGFGNSSISEFQNNLSSYISDADAIISNFKIVKNNTCSLNGGVGTLQSAIDDVDSRIRLEENKLQEAKFIQDKTNTFVELTQRIDDAVSKNVEKNKEEFYRIHSWLKPEISTEEEVPWYEKAYNLLCGVKEAVVDGTKKLLNGIKDTVTKIRNSLIEFYQENKKIIDTIVIVVGAITAVVAVVASGGWALVPLLINVFGISAGAAMTISSAVAVAAVVTTVASSTLNVVDIWAEIDNPFFNTVQNVLNISSAVLNLTYSIGNIYNSFKGYRITKFGKTKVIQDDGAFNPMQLDSKGRTNIERMNRKPNPLAPIGKDGKSMELHHLLQTEDGGLIELTRTNHRGAGRYSFWHNTDKNYQSVVDHGKDWIKFRKEYWSWRGSTNFKAYDKIVNIVTAFDFTYASGGIFTIFNKKK